MWPLLCTTITDVCIAQQFWSFVKKITELVELDPAIIQHNKFAQFSMRFDLKFFLSQLSLMVILRARNWGGLNVKMSITSKKRYQQRSQLCKSWPWLLRSGCLTDWEEIMILTSFLHVCRCSLAKIGSRWKSQTTERLQVHSSRKSGSRRWSPRRRSRALWRSRAGTLCNKVSWQHQKLWPGLNVSGWSSKTCFSQIQYL